MTEHSAPAPATDTAGVPSLHSLTVAGSATAPGDEPVQIVFLHGLFGQGRNFSTIAKALASAATSELIDLPNHGRSDWTEHLGYAEMADAVAAHLRPRAANQLPVQVVGHSMGGKVAMQLALRHPDLVDKLVVVDIAPSASNGAGEFAQLLDALAGLDLRGIERRTDADERLREAIPQDTVRAFLLQNLRGSGQDWRWQANLTLLRDRLGEIGGWPQTDQSFDHPVLWVAGERSDYIQPDDAPQMRRLFPRVVKVTVKGAGHWVHSEQPERFTATLRSFLLP